MLPVSGNTPNAVRSDKRESSVPPLLARITAFGLIMLLCSTAFGAGTAKRPRRDKSMPDDLSIISPVFGSTQDGPVTIRVRYVTYEDEPTVQVEINGNKIRHHRFERSCERHDTCTLSTEITESDGLRSGENAIRTVLTGKAQGADHGQSASSRVLTRRSKFDYYRSSGLTSPAYNTVSYYDPASIGLSTVAGATGSAPWVQLTTGYPADWGSADEWAFPAPPESNNAVTVPYADAGLPSNCTGTTFQAVVLNRQTPSIQETAVCFNSVTDLASLASANIGHTLGSSDLIIMGTTPGSTAGKIDTSSLGGRDYSNYPPSVAPLSYILIGVEGATPGTAYDAFSIPSQTFHPDSSYVPVLNGTLTQELQGTNFYYNFVPSGDQMFQVHSDGSGGSYITVGNVTYTPPDTSASFWLLALDRETLTPVNAYSNAVQAASCSASATNTATPTSVSCGATYSVTSDQGAALASEIAGFIAHDLIFLVSQGCPVQNTDQISISTASVLDSIGGAAHAINNIAPGGAYACAYSLVSINDAIHTHPLTDPTALSVGAFSTNNQFGSQQGFLGRNAQGLYDVAGSAQMVPNSGGSGFSSPVDFTLEQAATNQRQDWPLVEAGFPIEAYADVSYQIMNALGYTGSRMYDIRYFYTNSGFLSTQGLGAVMQDNVGTAVRPATNPFTKESWDNASPAQFTAILQQVGLELQYATKNNSYLGDSAGVAYYMAGSKYTIFQNMIDEAQTITTNYSSNSSAAADAKLSGELKLAAGVAGIGTVIPTVGPIFGAVAAGLRAGSSALDAEAGEIPSPQVVFLNSLEEISKYYATYTANLTDGLAGAIDNVQSDWGKLDTIGQLTSNTGSDWNFPNQFSPAPLQSLLEDGAARSMWMDILPKNYGVRYVKNGGAGSNAANYGYGYGGESGCNDTYKSMPAASYYSAPWIPSTTANPLFDVWVFANGVTPSHSHYDTAVDEELADQLTAAGKSSNGTDNLNIPPMLQYMYSDMTASVMIGPQGVTSPASYCDPHK